MQLHIDTILRDFSDLLRVHELQDALGCPSGIINFQRVREAASDCIFLLPCQILAFRSLHQIAYDLVAAELCAEIHRLIKAEFADRLELLPAPLP